VWPLWGPAAPDCHPARSRGHPDDPRAPGPRPLGAESRPRPTRVRRRRVLIGSSRARAPSCLRRETPSALIRPVRGRSVAGPWPVDGRGVPAYDAAQSGGRGRRARRLLMCAVASAPGWPASEYGRLCQGAGGHEGGHRCRRALMLTILTARLRARLAVDGPGFAACVDTSLRWHASPANVRGRRPTSGIDRPRLS
jgi:hypothetical protein